MRLLALASASLGASLAPDLSKAQQSQVLDAVPERYRSQVEASMEHGFDLSEAQVSAMKQLLAPTTPLTRLLQSVDPACLPEKCAKATTACRRADPKCEQRFECMEDEDPEHCWDMPLVDLSREEGALLMCGEKQECVRFGLSGGLPGLSLLQTEEGFALRPNGRSFDDLLMAASSPWHGRHLVDDGPDSFAEIDAKVDKLSRAFGGDDPFDLQRDIGAIASGDQAEDFDAAMERLEGTRSSMQKQNQELESLKLRLAGEEQRLAQRRPRVGDAAASFLETPQLVTLHQRLGDFLGLVAENEQKEEHGAEQAMATMKDHLHDVTSHFDLESRLYSPETKRALERASSFAEEEEEEGATAIDAAGNPTPAALLAISQLQHLELPPAEKFRSMMEGFQEAAGHSDPTNLTAMLAGVDSFLEDTQAYGAGHGLEDLLLGLLGPGEGHANASQPSLLEGSSSVLAALTGITVVNAKGLKPVLDGVETGPLGKYLKELGIGFDTPLVTAGAKFAAGDEAAGADMEKLLPTHEAMLASMQEILQDPAAVQQLGQLGMDVSPSSEFGKMLADPHLEATLKEAASAGASPQMRQAP